MNTRVDESNGVDGITVCSRANKRTAAIENVHTNRKSGGCAGA